jgi:hypothetical protein
MSTILKNLYEFTTQSLEPNSLTSSPLLSDDFASWSSFMSGEDTKLRSEITNYLMGATSACEKQIWLTAHQHQLVFISNLISGFLFRKKERWQSHCSSAQIRKHYYVSLSLIEELFDFVSEMFPNYYNYNQKLTDFRLKEVLPSLRKEIFDLQLFVDNGAVAIELSKIVVRSLQTIVGDRPSMNDVRYIRHLCATVRAQPNLDTLLFVDILIKLNFNQPEFFLYQIGILDNQLFNVNGLHEQRELLSRHKYDLRKIKPNISYSLYPLQSTLMSDLEQYYQEREEAVESLLQIRREATMDRVAPNQAFRILMDMTVPQLALFFRIQMEVGLLIKEQISEVFTFVAQHFYTEKAYFISSTNMLKLSSTIEFNTVLKVYDMLSMMIKWLDEQFGVSNYSR